MECGGGGGEGGGEGEREGGMMGGTPRGGEENGEGRRGKGADWKREEVKGSGGGMGFWWGKGGGVFVLWGPGGGEGKWDLSGTDVWEVWRRCMDWPTQ